MNSDTRNMINSLTEDIIHAFRIKIPIEDIEGLVCSLGGSIQIQAGVPDGAVIKDGDAFRILVSPFQEEKRKRFTIAHELGHLFLHMGYLTNRALWERQNDNVYHRIGNSEQEYQANEFAASLLMPRDEYVRVLEQHTDNNQVDTAKVAEYFQVSIEAASNRGKFLGYLKW